MKGAAAALIFFAKLANIANIEEADVMSAQTKVSAAEFQNNFGRYSDAARRAPVFVTRYGRDELVVVSAEEYARLRSNYRHVITLSKAEETQATAMLQALLTAAPNPNAAALNHLMDETD